MMVNVGKHTWYGIHLHPHETETQIKFACPSSISQLPSIFSCPKHLIFVVFSVCSWCVGCHMSDPSSMSRIALKHPGLSWRKHLVCFMPGTSSKTWLTGIPKGGGALASHGTLLRMRMMIVHVYAVPIELYTTVWLASGHTWDSQGQVQDLLSEILFRWKLHPQFEALQC